MPSEAAVGRGWANGMVRSSVELWPEWEPELQLPSGPKLLPVPSRLLPNVSGLKRGTSAACHRTHQASGSGDWMRALHAF